jgi:uncharacterized protein YutE (UPF0331/DUF86 family)
VIDRDKVRDKVAFIRRNLDMLRRLADIPRDGFSEGSIPFHAAVRLLQTSIEAMIDTGSHIVAREGLGSPKSYAEVFDVLSSAGVIPTEFIDRVKAMVRFRNRAVHLYGEIDVDHVYSILQNDLGDFDAFVGFIVSKYLP